jgi:hypothetical protein
MLRTSHERNQDADVLSPPIFESIIKTLLYFDIFNYPLKISEILTFLARDSNEREVSEAIEILVDKEYVYQFNEFISVQNKKENVARRVKGNEMAESLLPLARRKAHFIGQFPFVKAVMASGSMSKGYMDEDSDLDFFIVTEPGRLWIARTLLVMYKRVFLKNSHKHFCVNYFVSSDRLEIEEKNQFTATELATVIPLFNQGVYFELLRDNGWLTRFYPNFVPRIATRKVEKLSFMKKIVEGGINFIGGKMMDEWCMKITYNRWMRVYRSQYSESDFNIAFKTRKYVSKNHPKHYQKKISEVLEQKWKAYAQRNNVAMI